MINVYDVSKYSLGTKDDVPSTTSTDSTTTATIDGTEGTKQTVYAALVAHVHRHPVVFMLQDTANGQFSLPGGTVPPGEDEIAVLSRALNEKISPPESAITTGIVAPVWQDHILQERLLATFWRPHANREIYPYLPVHITTPAERISVYLVELPDKCALACTKNTSIVAVPFYDLYNNNEVFGTIASSLPTLLSRYEFIYC